MNEQIQIAFNNGLQSFRDGHSTNPYPIFTTNNRAWFQGWTKARKAAERAKAR